MAILSLKLARGLPLLEVLVSASGTQLRAMHAEEEELPAIQQATALIDTGAGMTAIDYSILDALKLVDGGTTRINTPSTGPQPVKRKQCNVGIVLLTDAEQRLVIPSVRVIATDLSYQGFKVLLGRDVLSRCLFVYDGKHQSFTLAY